jgi:hypothetical protein
MILRQPLVHVMHEMRAGGTFRRGRKRVTDLYKLAKRACHCERTFRFTAYAGTWKRVFVVWCASSNTR